MYKILQLTTYGIKSLEKPVTINFSNATIEKGLKKLNNVKGIYGYNGAGKSALIEAVYFYKMIATTPDFLLDSENKLRLSKLVNYKTGEFYVSVVFSRSTDDGFVYKHEMRVKKDDIRNAFVIEEEKLSVSKKRTINEEFDVMAHKKQSEIYLGKGINSLPDYMSMESLRYSSIPSLILDNIDGKDSKSMTALEVNAIHFLGFPYLSLEIYLSDSDKHTFKPKNSLINYFGVSSDKIEQSLVQPSVSIAMDKAGSRILKSERGEFEKENEKLEKFIKIFKPSLKSIGLVYREDRDFLNFQRYFVYDGYNVDLEFESSGIKQLVELFPFLNECANGSIVFIDELDTNINSVYLEKLISYFKEYGKGQLIFTTHNIMTMDVLKSQKRSIEILGDDGNIDVWVKTGNRAPSGDYVNGNFEHSPMNIEDFDFLSVFQGDSDE